MNLTTSQIIFDQLKAINDNISGPKTKEEELRKKSFRWYTDVCHISEEIFCKCIHHAAQEINDIPKISRVLQIINSLNPCQETRNKPVETNRTDDNWVEIKKIINRGRIERAERRRMRNEVQNAS